MGIATFVFPGFLPGLQALENMKCVIAVQILVLCLSVTCAQRQGRRDGPSGQVGQNGRRGPPSRFGQGQNGPPPQFGQGQNSQNGPPSQFGQGQNGPPSQFGQRQ